MKVDKFLLLALGALAVIIILLLAMGGAAFLCLALSHTTITDDTKTVYRDNVYNGSLAGTDLVALNVHGINGNVVVEEGAGDSYTVEVHEKGTERSFQRYVVEFSESGATGSKTIDVIVKDQWAGQPATNLRYSADITVTVPKNKTYSVDLATVNGDIDAASLSGDTAAMNNVNGDITSAFSADRATFANVNGGIDVTTKKNAGDITATSVNGNIAVTVPKDAGLSVNAHVVNGDIKTYMALNTTEKSRFNVVGSTPGYSGNGFDLKLSLVNGDIKVNYA
jgi:DUF4097 and DUF4098 domain-containing protein YvlB